jgi:3-oxoacyl-[acyl-carrier-protein] synthase-1
MTAPPSAAAVRAGISGVVEHPYYVNWLGDPLESALDPFLTPSLSGPDRFVALAETALLEAIEPLDAAHIEPPRSLPLLLALPDLRPGFSAGDAEAIRAALEGCDRLRGRIGEVRAFPGGHAAGVSVLAMAAGWISRGVLDACVVGGIESYFHPATLSWLDRSWRLSGAAARSAFVPGEGAGFLLLTSARIRGVGATQPWARVTATGGGLEAATIGKADLCLGKGLIETIRATLACVPEGTRINHVICDLNGERYRSEEWGFVCLELGVRFDDPAAFQSPADCWGDMGAASIPLFAMLVCQAVQRGYSTGPLVLLFAGSDGGRRGAVVLRTVTLP